jgi:hypothetical protein
MNIPDDVIRSIFACVTEHQNILSRVNLRYKYEACLSTEWHSALEEDIDWLSLYTFLAEDLSEEIIRAADLSWPILSRRVKNLVYVRKAYFYRLLLMYTFYPPHSFWNLVLTDYGTLVLTHISLFTAKIIRKEVFPKYWRDLYFM